MAAIVSTRIIALEAISPRTDTSPVIEPMAVAPVNGAAFQAGATYANRAAAPFRVTPAGDLYAESGTFAGDLNTTGFIFASGNNPPGDYATYTIAGAPAADDINAIIGVAKGGGHGVSGSASGTGSGILGINTGTGAAAEFAGNNSNA